MNLADKVGQGEETFSLTLNYDGKYSFTQDACRFYGKEFYVRDVMRGRTDFFLLSEKTEKCADIFNKFDAFMNNLNKHSEPERYSAILVSGPDRMLPVIAIDHQCELEGIEVAVFLFSEAENILFGFERGDVEQSVRNMIAAGEDLSNVDAWLRSKLGEPTVTRREPHWKS